MLQTLVCEITVEAFDRVEDKMTLITAATKLGKEIVSVSGIAGFGGTLLTKKTLKGLTIVGDFVSDIATLPPLGPKVVWAAAMMADAILELILRE